MRERLIELFKQADEKAGEYIRENDHMDFIPTKDELAGVYADHLLANGVIVPPCKVGDTVYVVSQGAGFSVVWNVYKAVAKAIHLDQYGKLFVRVETDKENVGGYVEIERVFLTREEAEEALEKMRGDAK